MHGSILKFIATNDFPCKRKQVLWRTGELNEVLRDQLQFHWGTWDVVRGATLLLLDGWSCSGGFTGTKDDGSDSCWTWVGEGKAKFFSWSNSDLLWVSLIIAFLRKIKKIYNQRRHNWSSGLPQYPGKYWFPVFGIGNFDKMCPMWLST